MSELPTVSMRPAAWLKFLAIAFFTAVFAAPTYAQEDEAEFKKLLASIKWKSGPGEYPIGSVAKINLPKGYQLTDANGARVWEKLNGNPFSRSELAILKPTFAHWFIVFDYDKSGYVKDDDKGSLDSNALLEQFREGERQSNPERLKQGMPPVYVQGFVVEPNYDDVTHNLNWGMRFSSIEQTNDPNEMFFNYTTHLLGREGSMKVILVTGPDDDLEKTIDETKMLMSNFEFVEGKRYADWKPGDKVAAYGLTGLVLGGTLAAAAKFGLFKFLAKGGKLVVFAIIAVGAGIWKFVKGLFGGGQGKQY